MHTINSEKKIVMLIDTLAYGGGAERQFAGLALSLHKAGYNVKVLAYYTKRGYQDEFEKAGLDYMILSPGDSRLSKLKAVRKQIAAEKPDVVISYKDAPNIAACLLKALGAKWKLIVSDRNTLQQIDKTTKIQYRFFYKFADVVVPNSYAQKKFIDSHFPSLSPKIKVITNFTDTTVFSPASERMKSQAEIKKILVVARIAKQKNTLKFIEAARLLAPRWRSLAKIEWYGAPNVSESEYADQCKAKIDEYGLRDFFMFNDTVANIAEVYRSADVFCLPSKWEGFPNALCEAMASGLAVCASDICDNSLIIDNNKNGVLFNPSSASDIAEKIDQLLSMEKSISKQFSANARKYAVENLSAESFLQKYAALL